ncbi:hypothetical protein OF83DRAFT_296742 [Amylostereum chailletii]|nr:hypothetical protein OF83DRAFT_296742 [Amylostereum chailletii]
MFPADVMHLVCLNQSDLMIGLWRGSLTCDPADIKDLWDWAVLRDKATWEAHGILVASATPFLPGSFDRPPRNPVIKLSSGYKAWEFLLYIFGMCPVILYGILLCKYWRNFCKLVVGIRILYAHAIRRVDLRMAQKLLLEFAREFELLYYQRKESRLHFCRQSIHQVAHMAPESGRVGPLGLVGQWVMERTIGDLGQEVKQPSNPYANLSQRGLQRAQVNALKSVMPDLEADKDALPRGSVDLGDKYVLLRPMDTVSREVPYTEADFINAYWVGAGGHGAPGGITHVRKWGRVRLANGQNARSA